MSQIIVKNLRRLSFLLVCDLMCPMLCYVTNHCAACLRRLSFLLVCDLMCPMLWLQANYGRHDSECVQKVKDVYRALQLPKVYSDYEQSSFTSLLAVIDECSASLPRDMFLAYAQKIYKRQK